MSTSKIIWTKIDEAPALATYCLLPIVQGFTKGCDIDVETRDISLAGRVIANFPDNLTEEQKIPDFLSELGASVVTPDANIIKLPNISASIPQLQATIAELREKGYDIPEFPEEPKTDEEKALRERFSVALGSAVNPVLRMGNSDRRPAASVKKFAQVNPHKMMKQWPESGSKARVVHMNGGDFFESENSVTMDKADTVKFEFVDNDGNVTLLKEGLELIEGEVLDSSRMNVKALRAFFAEHIAAAKADDVLFSLHLKATMMKVSDPIMFGHAVAVYYKEALDKHWADLEKVGVNLNNGLQDVYDKMDRLGEEKAAEVKADLEACYKTQPSLAMVNSYKGITNLHVPNDVIIDASMPNVVRDGGRMWNWDDKLQDCIAAVPDRCYATMYKVILEDAKALGQFDPSTMGNVANVGLMAKKAEEYGSHDKTFEAPGDGTIRIVGSAGNVLLEQKVETGDVYRACQTKDDAIRDWVKLAVNRAKDSGSPVLFWLNPERGHDTQILAKLEKYITEHDTSDIEYHVMKPDDAMRFSLERVRKGEDAIAATGNVLRDYLTDLFPILELGTSARMLSIVPLMAGGGLFETGAGGSAPKHVQQMEKEGHLRWDSLGEYCALVPSLELIYKNTGNAKAKVLAATLDKAVENYLMNGRLPSRKVNEIDNRGSSFYLALYWAQALAAQDDDPALKDRFSAVAAEMAAQEEVIAKELLDAQGTPMDVGGYFMPNDELANKVMRPSATLNAIIDKL